MFFFINTMNNEIRIDKVLNICYKIINICYLWRYRQLFNGLQNPYNNSVLRRYSPERNILLIEVINFNLIQFFNHFLRFYLRIIIFYLFYIILNFFSKNLIFLYSFYLMKYFHSDLKLILNLLTNYL